MALRNLPHNRICVVSLCVDYTMICPHGRLTISRHNKIRNMTEDWLWEICMDVEKEPLLQPLRGEHTLPRSANKQKDHRLAI